VFGGYWDRDRDATIVTGYLFALLLAQATTERSSSFAASGWTTLPGRPAEDQLRCVPYREDFWSVRVANGSVTVSARGGDVDDPLPFKYSPDDGRRGTRRVLRVSDGWLVGFDAGEWGGGLWWFSRDGKKFSPLHPPKGTQSPDDPFPAENVLGFASLAGKPVVLMGLNHMGGRSGRAFYVVCDAVGKYRLTRAATLDASPNAWLSDQGRLLIVTYGGLWALEKDGLLRQLHALDLWPVTPDSMVRGGDRGIYLGLRHYLLRLESTQGSWVETWFAPSDCVSLRMKQRCECAPPPRE
jgi:hypothetical protein